MDARGRLLIEFDQEEAELRAQIGWELASQETRKLMALADGIARSLDEWRALASGVELTTQFDARRAGALVLESVFDEILAAPRWRLLAAAFALTELAG